MSTAPLLSDAHVAELAQQLAEQLAPKPLLNAEEAARLLNVPASWLLAQARADRCPHRRLGRYVRFDADELLAWTEQHARGPRGVRR